MNEKVLILSDQPGMGKSTIFKKIALDLKARNALKWIFYIDLKLYFTTFNLYREAFINNKIDWQSKIVDILKSMMKLNELEVKFLSEKMKFKEVIFLFDGVDEISPDHKNFIVEFMMQIIKITENQLWIASRPNCVKELIKGLNIKPHKLSPVDKKDFIEKFFQFNQILDRERLEKFLKFITKEWQGEYDNPLLIMIALEIHNELEDHDDFYTFFKIFFERKLKVTMDKGELRQKDFSQNLKVLQFHQKIAVEHLIMHMGENRKNLMRLEIMKIDKPPIDTIFGFGILYGDSYEHCFFAHQLFSEFFVSDYVIENVLKNLSCNDDEKELRMELFWLIMTHRANIEIQKFIECFLKKNPSIIEQDHSDLGKFLNSRFNEKTKEFEGNVAIRYFNAFSFYLHFKHVPMDSKTFEFIEKITGKKSTDIVKRCYVQSESFWESLPDFPCKESIKQLILSPKFQSYRAAFATIREEMNDMYGDSLKKFLDKLRSQSCVEINKVIDKYDNDDYAKKVIDCMVGPCSLMDDMEMKEEIIMNIAEIAAFEESTNEELLWKIFDEMEKFSPLVNLINAKTKEKRDKVSLEKRAEEVTVSRIVNEVANILNIVDNQSTFKPVLDAAVQVVESSEIGSANVIDLLMNGFKSISKKLLPIMKEEERKEEKKKQSKNSILKESDDDLD